MCKHGDRAPWWLFVVLAGLWLFAFYEWSWNSGWRNGFQEYRGIANDVSRAYGKSTFIGKPRVNIWHWDSDYEHKTYLNTNDDCVLIDGKLYYLEVR